MNFCKDCRKIWTAECPIRVWSRNAINLEEYKNRTRKPGVEVNPETDYC